MDFASCKAFGCSISASLPKPQTPSPWEGAILLGLPPPDPVGGFAPATPFLSTIEVYRQTEVAEIRRRLYYLSEISDTVMYALQLRAVIFYEIVIENYSSFKRFYAEVFVYCVCAVKLCARHHKRNESQYAIAYLRIVT